METPLNRLAIVDPDLAQRMRKALILAGVDPNGKQAAGWVEDVLWSLSQEIGFGQAVFKGYLRLADSFDQEIWQTFHHRIRSAGREGPTFGKIISSYLPPVLICGDKGLLEKFFDAVKCMKAKGTYTLKRPLECLTVLLESNHLKAATRFLDLIITCFSLDLNYSQCHHFATVLPRAMEAFSDTKRTWQIRQANRIMAADYRLIDSFLNGMENGLGLLSETALHRFVSMALAKNRQSRKMGMKFLSLMSKSGADTFSDLQVSVSLDGMQSTLNRYIRARTGLVLSVKASPSILKMNAENDARPPLVASDGRYIFLPDEIGQSPHKKDNIQLFKVMVKLETAFYEFRSYDFDLEKFAEGCGLKLPHTDETENRSDLERLFRLFPESRLAEDLFTIFELSRLRIRLSEKYPGLVKDALPVIKTEAGRMVADGRAKGSLFALYAAIVLDDRSLADRHMNPGEGPWIRDLNRRAMDRFSREMTVETSAKLLYENYAPVAARFNLSPTGSKSNYRPLATPFGQKFRPELFRSAHADWERTADLLAGKLRDKGIKVYRGDIRRRLVETQGQLSIEDIRTVILSAAENDESASSREIGSNLTPGQIDPVKLELAQFLVGRTDPLIDDDAMQYPVFRYKEWDFNLKDYLFDHTRVIERPLEGISNEFYRRVLARHSGLIRKIQRSFELLKPEGLSLLRQWIDGDEFDYRALLDFAIDRKAGIMPSDRLFIKRIKAVRDVSVMLLVDVSRSTANRVAGSSRTVLDVAKEAIVLFCKALTIVGDGFAIAAFSGNGRLGVDYYRVKSFEEPLSDRVQQKISALSPQRSTRMGAAIRHATVQLEKSPSKIRLLIIIGDGFPNDVDYKRSYAINDTRKAVQEAHSRNIHTHAVTVNLAGDPRLDDLYGDIHHNVITDVRELPDRLLRIYGALTRN
jgi:hypothetical protein